MSNLDQSVMQECLHCRLEEILMYRFKNAPNAARAAAAPRLRYRLIWIALLWPWVAVADERALSLEDAVDQALQENPQVAASAAMLNAAQEVAPSAGHLPDPELVTGVDNLPVSTAERYSFTRDFMTMRKVGVLQSFPNGDKRRLQGELAQREIAVAQGDVRKTRFDTARAVAEAWIACAVAEESLVRLRTLKPDAQLEAAAGRAALASGRASAAEALAAQSLLPELDERIMALKQETEMRRAELARWISSIAERPLGAIPTDRDLGPAPESLLAAVPQHAPLAPVLAKLAAAQTDVDLARAQTRPDWSAEFDYAQRGPDFSNMVSLEFHIALPLFPKNRQNPVIAEKLALVRAREAERDAEVRMHTAEIRSELAQWRQGRERLKNYATNLLPLARDRSRAAIASYGAGRGDLRVAIDALTQEINSQLEYVQLEGSVASAWAALHFLHDLGISQ
jgi:cobalt-zinc-cadmium efflux system outer membrane protein